MLLNLIFPIATMLFSAILYLSTFSLGTSTDPIGPGGWPRIITTCAFFIGMYLLVKELIAIKSAKKADEKSTLSKEIHEKMAFADFYAKYRHWAAYIAMTIPALTMGYLGFPLAIFLFLNAMALMLGMRNWKVLLTVSILTSGLISFLFMRVMMMSLPMGVGVFRMVSRLFSNR